MDRETLSYFLSSGSSRVFDPRKVASSTGRSSVFRTAALNQCYFFKYPVLIDQTRSNQHQHPVVTLAYYPYDRNKPVSGGESFIYEPDTLQYYLKKFSHETAISPDRIAHDQDVLAVLDSIPTFSPFLLKEAFERSDVGLKSFQFEITEEEANKIKQTLRNRLRPLVGFAFSNESANRQAVEQLTDRLWRLDDMESLAPLIQAFRMPRHRAKDLFYGWTGITFFEQEYVRLQPSLRELAQWFVAAAKPKENMPNAVLDPYLSKLGHVKGLVRNHWRGSLTIIDEYTKTYSEMLSSTGNTAGFVKFLNQSSDHFWALGAHLSRLDHGAEVLQRANRQQLTPPYSYDYCERVLSVIGQTLGQSGAIGDQGRNSRSAIR